MHHKSITISDWVRAFYYAIYTEFGLTNKYRYDHFVSKSDAFYEFEKAKLALNI